MSKQIEVGALVEVFGVDATGGVVSVVRGDKIHVVFDGGQYGWYNIVDVIDNAAPAVVGKDGNIVIETEVQPDAVTEKQIALIEQELAEVPTARNNRRAIVKSITLGGVVRVSIQAWQRIIPRADESQIGDSCRWVELRSVRF